MKPALLTLYLFCTLPAVVAAQEISGKPLTEKDYLANPSSANLEFKYGFRDLRFETDTAHITGLQLVQRGAGALYVRPTDRPFIGAARVSISYGFVLGRLASVELATTQRADSEALLRALRTLYGQEDLVQAYQRVALPYHHQWTTARCLLSFDILADGSARAAIISTRLYELAAEKGKGRPALGPGDL